MNDLKYYRFVVCQHECFQLKMEDFLSIPPYIWKGIFSLLKILGAGFLLALFATKYQKRKEIELQVKANVLKLQLESYVKLNAIFSEIQSIIAPPLHQEVFFASVIDTTTLGIKYMEYSSFFDSMECFDGYYKRLLKVQKSEHIYMQYSVEQKLSEFISYLTELKIFLDAFCDTEHTTALGLDKKTADEHIQKAYQLVGICVQNDMGRFYGQMDQLLAYEVSHITLSYRSHYLKSIKEKVMKFISEHLEKYIDQDNTKGRAANWFYFQVIFRSYGNSVLLTRIPTIIMHLAFLHYSRKITPEEWYDQPEKMRTLMEEFLIVYRANLHHG